MDMEFKFGRTELSMRDIGDSIRLADMASSGTLMATFSKENGLTTRPMDTEFIFIKTVLSTKDFGKMICNMALD